METLCQMSYSHEKISPQNYYLSTYGNSYYNNNYKIIKRIWFGSYTKVSSKFYSLFMLCPGFFILKFLLFHNCRVYMIYSVYLIWLLFLNYIYYDYYIWGFLYKKKSSLILGGFYQVDHRIHLWEDYDFKVFVNLRKNYVTFIM